MTKEPIPQSEVIDPVKQAQLEDLQRLGEQLRQPIPEFPTSTPPEEAAEALFGPTEQEDTARTVGGVAIKGVLPLSPFSGKPMKLPSESAKLPRAMTAEEKAEYGLPEDYTPPAEQLPISPIQLTKERKASWNERKADFDSLTGLANRKALQERFDENGIASAEGVAVVDLNKFKDLNDKFGGHAAGDAGLQMFSRLLEKHMNGSGLAYRTGGDEFVLVFDKGVSQEDIELAIKGITEGASGIVFPRTPDTPADEPREAWEGGASIGYVSSSEVSSLEEGLKVADDNMYRKKHGLPDDAPIPERKERR